MRAHAADGTKDGVEVDTIVKTPSYTKDCEPNRLIAQFTRRDVIIYALSIGCCSNDENNEGDDAGYAKNDGKDENNGNCRSSRIEMEKNELRYVYERHPSFEVFPTFLLSLLFIAELKQQPAPISSTSNSTSVAKEGSYGCNRLGFGIRPFPPEYMSSSGNGHAENAGLIPRKYIRSTDNLEDNIAMINNLPILHMHQSLTLHRKFPNYRPISNENTTKGTDEFPIDPPQQVYFQTKITSIKPSSVGVFVTSETEYQTLENGNVIPIATSQSTALVLGLDPDVVIPFDKKKNKNFRAKINHHSKAENKAAKISTSSSPTIDKSKETVIQYQIPKNAALLYRLNGDYNPIHVEEPDDVLSAVMGVNADKNDNDRKRKKQPVLHGLCTMGYAVRAVLRHCCKSKGGYIYDIRLLSVRCNFVKPVFVGDTLRVVVWENNDGNNVVKLPLDSTDRVLTEFRVYRVISAGQIDSESGRQLVVDKGVAEVQHQFKNLLREGSKSRM